MHFRFLENGLNSALHKHFLLRRTSRTVKKYVRQRARPHERRYLRQQLVGDAVLHRDRCLEKRVDTVSEHVRTLSACGDQTPVHFRASTISYKDHNYEIFRKITKILAYMQIFLYLCAKFVN